MAVELIMPTEQAEVLLDVLNDALDPELQGLWSDFETRAIQGLVRYLHYVMDDTPSES